MDRVIAVPVTEELYAEVQAVAQALGMRSAPEYLRHLHQKQVEEMYPGGVS